MRDLTLLFILIASWGLPGIVPAESQPLPVANTDPSWEAALDPGHRPNSLALKSIREHHFYYAAAPGEQRLGDLFDWNWDSSLSRSPRWRPAFSIGQGHPCTITKGPRKSPPSGGGTSAVANGRGGFHLGEAYLGLNFGHPLRRMRRIRLRFYPLADAWGWWFTWFTCMLALSGPYPRFSR